MIIYDLLCDNDHAFEGWFKSREDFDREKEEGRLFCPLCSDTRISLLPSGGHTSAKARPSERRKGVPAGQALAQYLEKNFENVGGRFADEAIRMHFGDIDYRNIRGTMTPEEEKDLREEGVAYFKVPVLKYQS